MKISATAGGFAGALDNNDLFGFAVANIGDLDGDGVQDLAVGAMGDDDGGVDHGAVYVLFMNSDGTVKSEQKISSTAGNFGGTIGFDDRFGSSVAGIGDLNGDGVRDLAVGMVRDDDGGTDKGAVWILFMNSDGTVTSEQKISQLAGNFGGGLAWQASFGASVADIGDLDGDGVRDLAVGAHLDNGGWRGAVWILFMNTDGTVASEQKIASAAGGFGGVLDNADLFGYSVASIGDLDGDGVNDLAVGCLRDDDGGTDRGAVWILFMNSDGTVASEQRISDTAGGFAGALANGDNFGSQVAGLGDLNGDGVEDLVVGALFHDDGGPDRGAVWILFMNSDGTVAAEQKISDTAGGFSGALDDLDYFSRVANIGDLNGDGITDLAVGAWGDDDGGLNGGAVWVLFLSELCAYGPDETPLVFTRTSGAPQWETYSWESCGGNGLMVVQPDRVSSAYLYLNGELLVAPNDLHQGVGMIEIPVVLGEGTNVLDIQMRGKPGSSSSVFFFEEE